MAPDRTQAKLRAALAPPKRAKRTRVETMRAWLAADRLARVYEARYGAGRLDAVTLKVGRHGERTYRLTTCNRCRGDHSRGINGVRTRRHLGHGVGEELGRGGPWYCLRCVPHVFAQVEGGEELLAPDVVLHAFKVGFLRDAVAGLPHLDGWRVAIRGKRLGPSGFIASEYNNTEKWRADPWLGWHRFVSKHAATDERWADHRRGHAALWAAHLAKVYGVEAEDIDHAEFGCALYLIVERALGTDAPEEALA